MPVTTVHQLQSLIRGRRQSLRWSQQQVADNAGVSRKWLSDFERGATTAVELPPLLKVLAALQLEIEIGPRRAADSEVQTEVPPTVDLDLLLTRYSERGDHR